MIRDETKYHRLIDFARALPKIRTKVERDLVQPILGREKVLATLVRLLAVSLIRIGNEDSARDNHTYGLTTMKNRHAVVRGGMIRFHFRGKSGKEHTIDVEDKRLAKTVRACKELPGQDLFQYIDPTGQKHAVASGDVNDYLRTATSGDFTAKDFRTWAGTLSTLSELRKLGTALSSTLCKRNIVSAIKTTAKRLGNTVAVCRKSYIHPVVLDAYSEGTLISDLEGFEKKSRKPTRGLLAEEQLMVKFLEFHQNMTLNKGSKRN
jgi:DNA topoisomerase-1